MIKMSVLALFSLVLLFCLPGCSSKKGPLVAKVKGLKIYQSELDSQFIDIRDKTRRNERLKEYIRTQIDEQVMFLKAKKMRFDRQKENKAILHNIELIETANYYSSDILQKNWGFTEKEVLKEYQADKEQYRKEKPVFSATPTPEQKKELDEYNRDPYKPVEQVRSKILRKLLLGLPQNKNILDSLAKSMGSSVDSFKLRQKEDELISSHIGDLEERTFEKLKKDHRVEIFSYVPSISEAEIRAEWEKTKSLYKRKPDYVVQHIEVADEKTARDLVDKINNKNKDFVAIQKKQSLNKDTKGKDITIQADADVPALTGLSDTRGIYSRILYTPVGKVSMPIPVKTADGKEKQHLFKIVSIEPEAIQTFEEAKAAVQAALFSRKQLDMPLTTILGKVDGRPITAEELFTLLYKMSPMVVERYRTEEGRKMLLEKYYLRFLLYPMLAKDQGVAEDPVLAQRILKSQKVFLISDFRQNYFDVFYGLPESEVLKYYKAHPDSFMGPDKKVRPFEQVKAEAVGRVLVTPKMVEDYYAFNMEDFADADGAPKPLEAVFSTINFTLIGKMKEKQGELARRKFRKEFGCKVYKKELDFNLVPTQESIFEEAKKLHEERKYGEATRDYLELRFSYPQFKSHPDICMALAQIYIEQNQFNKAIQEYKRFLRLYPDNKDRYKAQFMIGFVYSENIKDKDKAITSYQSVLDNYPSCDLTESAKFMIDHLKSGKDDFAFLQDSTQVADSVTAGTVPVAAPAKKK